MSEASLFVSAHTCGPASKAGTGFVDYWIGDAEKVGLYKAR